MIPGLALPPLSVAVYEIRCGSAAAEMRLVCRRGRHTRRADHFDSFCTSARAIIASLLYCAVQTVYFIVHTVLCTHTVLYNK